MSTVYAPRVTDVSPPHHGFACLAKVASSSHVLSPSVLYSTRLASTVRIVEHHDVIVIGSGLRRQRRGAAPRREGLPRRSCSRRAGASTPPTSRRPTGTCAAGCGCPSSGLRGIFQMSFFEHVTILHGRRRRRRLARLRQHAADAQGRLLRARRRGRGLADWKRELAPHYATARRMLGATPNPRRRRAAIACCAEIARDIGRAEHHHPTDVAVYFGEPGETVPDPYFGGEGPERTGCIHCGACMTGCRVGAKNTLDKNYLYLAEKRGATVRAETEVTAVRARARRRLRVETRPSFRGAGGAREALSADNVIFAGGVLGTVPLLLAHAGGSPTGCRGSRRASATSCAPTPRRSSASSRPSDGRLLEGHRHHVDPPHRRALPHRAGPLRRRLRLLPPAGAAARARRQRRRRASPARPGSFLRHPRALDARARRARLRAQAARSCSTCARSRARSRSGAGAAAGPRSARAS